MRRVTALVAATLGLPALAAEPSFDCAHPSSSAEEAVCGSDALAALDVELERLYRAAFHGSDMTPERRDLLRATERGWVEGRDTCSEAEDDPEGCLRDAYAIRIHELRRDHDGARTGAGASTGPFRWACHGLASDITAVFVTRPAALVSLNWGENWSVLPQVRAASGARYEADSPDGRPVQFWERGSEAMFIPPGGPQTGCRLEPAD